MRRWTATVIAVLIAVGVATAHGLLNRSENSDPTVLGEAAIGEPYAGPRAEVRLDARGVTKVVAGDDGRAEALPGTSWLSVTFTTTSKGKPAYCSVAAVAGEEEWPERFEPRAPAGITDVVSCTAKSGGTKVRAGEPREVTAFFQVPDDRVERAVIEVRFDYGTVRLVS